MYESFYGLRERPFDLTPNPKYLYLTAKHREALGNLQYGIISRKSITLLVGEAGTGKTTLLRAALDSLASPTLRCVLVNNPVLTRAEFYELLAIRFSLSEQAASSKARFLSELEENVIAHRRSGGTTALVIDEAQALPAELMEEVRLLANFETDTERLLPVVLAGQPELGERLECEDLRQLKQRVALRCELLPLDLRETAAYIAGRIAIAGGEGAKTFTREAVQLIYERSAGIPRTISVICENALVGGFAAEVRPIGIDLVFEVCRDFRIGTTVGEVTTPGRAAHDEPHALLSSRGGHPQPIPASPRADPRRAAGGNGAGASGPEPPPGSRPSLFSHFSGVRRRRLFDFFRNRAGSTR